MLGVDVRLTRGGFTLDANFTAPTPGVTALFGRSGCGKTTLINLMAGLIDQGTGRIELDGDVWLDSSARRRTAAEHRRIGYVFQNSMLFPHYSVRGNLLYGARHGERSAGDAHFEEVVALLGLGPLLERRPPGLSGGERQRVALGRALLSRPRLLLLDEPLASLDAARRDEVLPYLERLRDRYAIPMVFVSHQYDEVLRLATHIVVLEQGRVVAAGDIGTVSLSPALQSIIGADALGAVLQGKVVAAGQDGLADVAIGDGILRVPAHELVAGQTVRVQMLARDIILAVEEPRGLSVRNQLRGRVTSLTASVQGDLIAVDVGGVTVLARITAAATAELRLGAGSNVWVLVKAVQLSGHAFPAQMGALPA
jgi:molybdate transport system ATP-binding protein